MKKFLIICAVLAFVCGGCASYYPMGVIVNQVQGPQAAGSGSIKYTKVGTAEAQSVLGIVATGDCSIKTAAQNGGITTIKFVDYKVDNILGIIGKYTTIVYGD